MANPLQEILDVHQENQHNDQVATDNGWKKKSTKKKSVVELGAKHAARTQAGRTAKQMFGNGLVGQIAALLARTAVNKAGK